MRYQLERIIRIPWDMALVGWPLLPLKSTLSIRSRPPKWRHPVRRRLLSSGRRARPPVGPSQSARALSCSPELPSWTGTELPLVPRPDLPGGVPRRPARGGPHLHQRRPGLDAGRELPEWDVGEEVGSAASAYSKPSGGFPEAVVEPISAMLS